MSQFQDHSPNPGGHLVQIQVVGAQVLSDVLHMQIENPPLILHVLG